MKKICICLAVFITTISANAGIVKKIPTRQGVTISFFYEKPEDAKAVVVLFQGGGGTPGVIGDETNGWVKNDRAFLAGGAPRFAKNKIVAVVVDPPSDRSDLNSDFRNSTEHNADIEKLVEFLRSDNPGLPVWLIGTSNGSLSAAGASISMASNPPAGIVLTSTVTSEHKWAIGRKYAHPVYRADLSKVKVPVLIVHHALDRCSHSLFEPISDLVKAFPNSIKVELIKIEGGQDNNDPCNGGYHQFLGIEQDVTDQISNWIKSRSQ